MWLSTVEIGADFAPLQKSSEITVLMYIYEPYPVAGMVLIPAQKLSGMCEHSLKISNKRNENVPFQLHAAMWHSTNHSQTQLEKAEKR